MTQFEGELLWPGILGQLSVITAFTTAIFCLIAYFVATRKQEIIERKNWITTGRVFFIVQAVATFLIGAALFYIIANHRFEYRYAWEHSSKALPVKYLLSCFWEGQEGSFLLWMFWTAVLGVIVMPRAGKHEPYVMAVFGLVQAFLGSMLLGIYIGDYKIGAAPFILLRDSMEAPIFQRADYLSFIKDGNGLNPLLQNYWMVIHPPTLFLGFAATLVPFAYAISAMWQREYQTWIKPVLPWSLFSGAVLGTGIMMGGAWAYESLTFGGYWAWDPVENASLVPWLILIAGIHTLLAYKKTGHSLRITMVFFLLTFILVLYSTFLTRSGILGDTSVHAFTDLGMSGQLVFYLLGLTIPSLALLIWRWKSMPSPQREENLYTREFWMFIGALMLLLASLQVTFTTSIPVYNAILGTKWAPPTDPVQHYNRWQIPFAIIIAILSTLSLFLKFKKTEIKYFIGRVGVTAALALVVTAVACWLGEIYEPVYVVLLFAGTYSIVANLYYFFVVLSGKLRVSGPALAHMGFGFMLVGILFSSYNQETISRNTLGIDFGEGFNDEAKRENMLLYKNISSQLGPYTVTYIGDSVAPPNHYYKVVYERFDSVNKKLVERFMLKPNAQINPKMGLISNPDTRHYWSRDIYTHVTSVPDKSKQKEDIESKFKPITKKLGDTIFTAANFVVLEKLERVDKDNRVELGSNDIAVGLNLSVQNLNGMKLDALPLYVIREGGLVERVDADMPEHGLAFRVARINPETQEVTLDVADMKPQPDYIVMKAIVFPQINLLWLGLVVMVSGFLISIVRIFNKERKTTKTVKPVEPVEV